MHFVFVCPEARVRLRLLFIILLYEVNVSYVDKTSDIWKYICARSLLKLPPSMISSVIINNSEEKIKLITIVCKLSDT